MEVPTDLYRWLVQHNAIDRSEQPTRSNAPESLVRLGNLNTALLESGVACAMVLRKIENNQGQPSEWEPIRELNSMRSTAVYNWSEVILLLRKQGVVVDQETKSLVLDGGAYFF